MVQRSKYLPVPIYCRGANIRVPVPGPVDSGLRRQTRGTVAIAWIPGFSSLRPSRRARKPDVDVAAALMSPAGGSVATARALRDGRRKPLSRLSTYWRLEAPLVLRPRIAARKAETSSITAGGSARESLTARVSRRTQAIQYRLLPFKYFGSGVGAPEPRSPIHFRETPNLAGPGWPFHRERIADERCRIAIPFQRISDDVFAARLPEGAEKPEVAVEFKSRLFLEFSLRCHKRVLVAANESLRKCRSHVSAGI
jgi:hypothetical protein